jgi:hypothetical protein
VRRFSLYAHTLRRLRWQQWVYRPLRRVQSFLPATRSNADAHLTSSARLDGLAQRVVQWGVPRASESRQRADDVRAGRFTFLNHTEELRSIEWTRRYVSHLWNYNLQYFDFARDLAWAYRDAGDAEYAKTFERLALSWIVGATKRTSDAWEPYAVAVRVVNWSVALLMLRDVLPAEAVQRIGASIHAQLDHLSRRLEWHLLGNHLQKDLSALFVGSLLFDDADAMRWRAQSAALLWAEVVSQVNVDGGHVERSPMYHAIALADYLEAIDLANASHVEVPESARTLVASMAAALAPMVRDDGSLHLFHDSANGIAPDVAWIDRMSTRVVGARVGQADGAWALPETGFAGYVARSTGERFVMDVGAPGPAHQPGHSHCSLLSFELDLLGAPLIVDAGVAGYDGHPLREYDRSTRAHNTVSIDGAEQSEVWGTFRMARQATMLDVTIGGERDMPDFRAAYRPFHGQHLTHERRVTRTRELSWTISDIVRGDAITARSYLHFHPDCSVEGSQGSWVVSSPGRVARVESFGMRGAALTHGWYSSEFGQALRAMTIEFDADLSTGAPFGYRISCRPAAG